MVWQLWGMGGGEVCQFDVLVNFSRLYTSLDNLYFAYANTIIMISNCLSHGCLKKIWIFFFLIIDISIYNAIIQYIMP